MEGLFALMTNFVYMHLMGSKIPYGLRTRNPMMFPSQSFKTKDAYISTVVVPAHWERFCKALNKPEWIDHPQYGDVVYRVKHYDKMESLVEQVTAGKSTADWLEIFERHQVAAAPINKVEDFFEDPQFSVLNLLKPLNHSKAGTVQIQTPPWQMSETACDVKLPPPALGEHSIQILQENGFDDAEIEILLKQGLIEAG
jgi:crotonobetainyl-CoA:carnitine CoA-transferase CaiB-like acyl-CoA transferase